MIAAKEWPRLQGNADRGAFDISLRLDGAVRSTGQNSAMVVSDAAAAAAAGHVKQARTLLAEARTMNAKNPTYYGAAWLALGELLFITMNLGSCAIF